MISDQISDYIARRADKCKIFLQSQWESDPEQQWFISQAHPTQSTPDWAAAHTKGYALPVFKLVIAPLLHGIGTIDSATQDVTVLFQKALPVRLREHILLLSLAMGAERDGDGVRGEREERSCQ